MTTPSNNLLPRPPIVVVMGHVDHGKTTLLDYIRKTNVASREAGGITQSIGAYEIEHSGRKMTFIDTPGHEAFSKMRSRGATAADLAILVVSADDGVKPQTAESIKILLETETPFVVAITKIDKETANVEKVKSSLAAEGVLLEGYGGSVSFQPVSAKSGDNVNELLDLLLLAADLENLTYDPSAPASGFVIETKMDRRRGLEATVIVTNGTLRHGTPISTKTAQGNVRILEDFTGVVKKELIPSSPALVIGFERLPQVGEEFSAGTMGELLDQTIKGNTTRTVTGANVVPDARPNCLRVIVKASDSGSLEALYEIVKAMAIEKPIQIVGDAVGEVNDNDVKLAISSKAVIIAFRSKTDKTAKALAEANRIDIISSDIIYDLTRSIEENVVRKLTPTSQGELEVLALFNAPKLEKQLIGGKVTHGTLRNKSMFILKREGATPMKGRILSVKQKKQEASEVAEGNECGIIVSVPVMVAVGDKIIVAHES